MAGAIAKITLCVGAGIAGSFFAKERCLSDIVSGATKIIFKQLKQEGSPSSVKRQYSDALLAQVNSLRHELQILASSRSVTIITAGARRFGIIIVAGVIGYGYVRWKGLKLPDMMFATRRGLSDACNVVAKELDRVYSSISCTEEELNSKISRLDNHLYKIADFSAAVQNEVSQQRDRSNLLNSDVQSVCSAVRSLEGTINRLELKQNDACKGMFKVCIAAQSLEHHRSADCTQVLPSSSSRPALEPPPLTPSRTESLPVDPPSPPDDSNGSPTEIGDSTTTLEAGSGTRVPENSRNESSDSGLSGMFSGGSAPVLLRKRRATNTVLQQMDVNTKQS